VFVESLEILQCKELAKQGIDFSEDLRSDNLKVFQRYLDHCEYFSIALAIALTWTKHAKYETGFFDFAVNYFDSDDSLDSNEVRKYAFRFGELSLATAMKGLKTFENHIEDIIPDFQNCDAKDLKKLQDKSLQKLHNLGEARKVSGVGPWLFLGPMKIILGTEKRLWGDPNIDSIILPTGLEVNRGIRKLANQDSPLAKGFDLNWIVNEEGTLLEGFSNDTLVQNVLKNIAETANTRVLHINSAFYLYGRE
jgi:hypothetical protein